MACYVTVRPYDVDLVSRPGRRAFSYACPFPDVEVGDIVLIPFGDRNHLVRGEVVELNPPYAVRKHATKWVAAHVDHRAHDMRMALGVPELTEGED